jgi:hypothetical protein
MIPFTHTQMLRTRPAYSAVDIEEKQNHSYYIGRLCLNPRGVWREVAIFCIC